MSHKPAAKASTGPRGGQKQGGIGGIASRVQVDPEVLKKRGERFGKSTPAAAAVVMSAEEEARRKARAERFALNN